MWILESDADFLQGKRMWLKPGQKYLFGRVKREDVKYALDHKTVSRKHFIITVDKVKSGDAGRIHARTQVTITDEKSKHGTYIDGEPLKTGSRVLKNAEHSIRPGTFPNELIVKWVPCVLTFQLTKKELKAGTLKTKADRLEDLDIKTIAEYSMEHTTHVVAGKRNTVKGLQALIQAKYVVSDSFVEAVILAAAPADLNEDENLSPLEQDFDKAWPDPKFHLPRAGREPSERPVSAYEPNPNRSQIFEHYTFVFGDKAQYENLLPAISMGHGKALLMKIVPGQTTVDETVQYMQNAAAKKGFGDPGEQRVNGGTIMVRWAGSEQHVDWTENLINQVALKLDQRAIDQAEFLDSILANDASLLRRSIPYASTKDGVMTPAPTQVSLAAIPSNLSTRSQTSPTEPRAPPSSVVVPALRRQTSTGSHLPSASEPGGQQNLEPHLRPGDVDPPPPPKRQKVRMPPRARFKDFDDDFDENAIPAYTQDVPSAPDSQSQDQEDDVRDHSTIVVVKDEPTTTRKRPHSPASPQQEDHNSDEEDLLNELLPATAALKRQNLLGPSSKSFSRPPQPKKKKVEVEIDVRAVARERRQQAEDAARKEREDLAEGLGYENTAGPAGLVNVKEMVIPPNRKAQNNTEHGDRWKEEWNGRKNFKRFVKARRAGNGIDTTTEARRRFQNVIVPLVEIKKRGLGPEDDFLHKRAKSTIQSQGQSQSRDRRPANAKSQPKKTNALLKENLTQTVRGTAETIPSDHDDDDDNNDDNDNSENAPATPDPATKKLQDEAAHIIGDDPSIHLDPDSPRQTRQTTQSSSTQNAKGKRPASRTPTTATTTKKRQKTIPILRDRGDGDGSDSDELKFRFGRSKKTKT